MKEDFRQSTIQCIMIVYINGGLIIMSV